MIEHKNFWNNWHNEAELPELEGSRYYDAETGQWGLGIVFRGSDGNFYFVLYRRRTRELKRGPFLIGPGVEAPPAVTLVRGTVRWWAAIPTAEGVDLYKSADCGKTWQLMRQFPGLHYPSLDSSLFFVALAGLKPADGQPWDADIWLYKLRHRTAEDWLPPMLVGHADMDRIALQHCRPVGRLYIFASRLKSWSDGELPGVLVYRGKFFNKPWELETVLHG